MIDVTDQQMDMIRAILSRYVPCAEVRAFGSRADGTARRHSDLDLAVVGASKIDVSTLNRLREAFEDSELPFRVDVLDWHTLAEDFRNVIAKHYVVIQPADGENETTDCAD